MTVGQGSDPSSLIEQFGIERKIKYKDESYLVRDNGAIFRQSKPRKPLRPLDNTWTFGRKNPSMLAFGSISNNRIRLDVGGCLMKRKICER